MIIYPVCRSPSASPNTYFKFYYYVHIKSSFILEKKILLPKKNSIPSFLCSVGITRNPQSTTFFQHCKVTWKHFGRDFSSFRIFFWPIILNLSFMVNNPHHKNVCEFTKWILIIVNKRNNMKNDSFCIHILIGVSLLILQQTLISISLLTEPFLDTIKSLKKGYLFQKLFVIYKQKQSINNWKNKKRFFTFMCKGQRSSLMLILFIYNFYLKTCIANTEFSIAINLK